MFYCTIGIWCVCVCVFAHARHVCVSLCVHTYMHVCVCVYMCVTVYVTCVFTFNMKAYNLFMQMFGGIIDKMLHPGLATHKHPSVYQCIYLVTMHVFASVILSFSLEDFT